MLQITVSNQIEMQTIADIPEAIINQIVSDLTLENPEFQQALKYGYNTIGKPRFIELFRREGTNLILPRGYINTLIKHLRNSGAKHEILDNRLVLPEVNFGSRIQLRDYQEAAVSSLILWKQGGVVAPCGAGKTMIGLEAMARIQQPALWVCHTRELAEQTIDRACSVFDIERSEVGLIGDGKFSIGDRLTVALVQTLSKSNIDDFKHRFGAIFVDEAHHLAARSFFYPIGQFPAKYRIWVSATPDRADGLTGMVFAAAGNIVHTIQQSAVPTIIPQLRVIETSFQCKENDYVKIIGDLIHDDTRNRLIVETVATEAEGNYSLLLSDRVEHLIVLKQMLEDALPDKRIEILTGKMSKKQRTEVMDLVQNREIDVLLSTQLAREGLDIKHLNRLFLATPKRAGAAVQQEVGRIMRPEVGKTDAVVYDFWDTKQPMLRTQFWKRREVYRKIGMDCNLKGQAFGTKEMVKQG